MRRIVIDAPVLAFLHANVAKRWSQTKRGSAWAEGLNPEGTFYGLCGEYAVGTFLGLPVNLETHEKGVLEDFSFRGYNIEVKTSDGNFGEGLLKVQEANGFRHDLKSDIYVFCTVKGYKEGNPRMNVDIQGIISRAKIIREYPEMHPAKSKKSKHLNLEIPYSGLSDISEIFSISEKTDNQEQRK